MISVMVIRGGGGEDDGHEESGGVGRCWDDTEVISGVMLRW